MVTGKVIQEHAEQQQKTGTGFSPDASRAQLRLSDKERTIRSELAASIERGAFSSQARHFILAQFDRAIYRAGLLLLSDFNVYARKRILSQALAWEKPKPKGGRPTT